MSKLTLLGFGILAWGGCVALVALSFTGRVAEVIATSGGLAATAGLVIAIVGAARHGDV